MKRMPPGHQNRWYVGQCIYCGVSNTPLSNEHAVPYTLNGTWILEKASCASCATITSRFELNVMRGFLQYARAALKLKTRRTHSNTFPLVIERDGRKETINLSPDEYGAVLMLPDFRIPAYLDKHAHEPGITLVGNTFVRIGGLDKAELKRRYGQCELGFTVSYKPGDLARFFAKVAYSMSVAKAVERSGLREVERLRALSYVLPVILGRDEDLEMWVGSIPPEERPDPNASMYKPETNEIFRIQLDERDGIILARIRLIGQVPTPTYMVVVGRVPPDVAIRTITY